METPLDDREEIAKLPSRETIPTEKDQAILERYFPEDETKTKLVLWKVVLIATLLCIALCNPFVDRVLSGLPYCAGYVSYLVRAILFAGLLVLALHFA